MQEGLVVAGDVGATKTALALYGAESRPLRQAVWKNSELNSLDEALAAFLAGQETGPLRACFGVAGPVRGNRAAMTNLNWQIDGDALARQFGLRQALLVNDLVAAAAGAALLPADKLRPLNAGQPDPSGCVAVLAVGTGLGEAFLAPGQKRPFPTEGGHASFAPRTEEQIDLLRFLLKQQPHVSVEQVCSGMALPDLHAFMLTRCPEPDWMTRQRQEADAAGLPPLIVSSACAALSGSGPACEPAVRALRLLTDILAAEAANLALKTLATGGVYIGGGMTPRLLPFFEPERFMAIFCRGVYQDMLAGIPVHLILEPDTALIGARQLALES
jgi:glucokinase